MRYTTVWVCFFAWLQTCAGDIILSQILEGSSDNKAISLSNRGSTPANLKDYSLSIAYNGNSWRSVANPVGTVTLQPGETFTLCHTKISGIAEPLCDVLKTQINFNGNDAIGLEENGVLKDTFGEESAQNAELKSFPVDGLPGASLDHTSVRLPTVRVGTTDWGKSSAVQWVIYPQDTFVDEDGGLTDLSGRTQSPEETSETDTQGGGSDTGGLETRIHSIQAERMAGMSSS